MSLSVKVRVELDFMETEYWALDFHIDEPFKFFYRYDRCADHTWKEWERLFTRSRWGVGLIGRNGNDYTFESNDESDPSFSLTVTDTRLHRKLKKVLLRAKNMGANFGV
jgi:hypothetical protein